MTDENAIQPIDDFERMIAEIETIDHGVEFLNKLDILQQMLKKADVWHEKASQFIALEARALIKVAEVYLSMHPNYNPEEDYPRFGDLRGSTNKYRVLCWLIEISSEEREEVYQIAVDSCQSLIQVWKTYVVKPDKKNRALDELEWYKESVIEEFKRYDKVVLSKYDHYLESAAKHLDASVIKGFKDEVRDEVRRMGGHGLGDGEGTYLTADECELEIQKMVRNKVKSINRDIRRLNEIMVDDDYVPEFKVERKCNFNDDLTMESYVGIMLSLCGVGKTDFGSDVGEFGKLKMIAEIINHFGYSPYEYISELVHYCRIYGVQLCQYGFPSEDW